MESRKVFFKGYNSLKIVVFLHIYFSPTTPYVSLAFISDARFEYSQASGQVINYEKSGVFASANATKEDKLWLCDFWGAPILGGDIKYLGVPTIISRARTRDFQFIIDRVAKKLEGWKNLLSQADKEVLIKAAIQALPSYTMSCFILPKSICAN